MAGALERARLQMADACQRPGRDRGRKRGREDEPRGKRADRIAEVARAGNVAAHDAEPLGERAVDDVDPVHDAVALGNAPAARAVDADRVHLVEVGQRAILVGEIADRRDRRDMPVHGVDALEGDDLRRAGRQRLELRLEIGDVVVAEDAFLALPVADALDHRRVVLLVREDDAAGEQLDERRERRVVGDVGGGEEKGRLLAVEVGELGLELDMIVGRPRDIARAAGAGPDGVDRRVHGSDHLGMLTHAEIIVRAPHRTTLREPFAAK